ncbi:unnamed protein product [Mytilus coruscus]|uniref:THAP-type domain-containing protein n=1 Tax=Mytilus coruscus TaxID=42192 RepID=A0A6J8B2H2_MYTCO|nr:unnamed protein product [Mytilus coruscus]
MSSSCHCKNDGRYPERLAEKDVFLIPFPKPLRNRLKCERWIQACGRHDLSVEKVTKYSYICSLHFVRGNGPTEDYTDPIPAGACEAEKENFMLQNRKRRAPIDRPSLVCRKDEDIRIEEERIQKEQNDTIELEEEDRLWMKINNPKAESLVTANEQPRVQHPIQTRKSFFFYKIESPLSNFYAARFKVSGKWYTSTEQFYMYKKAATEENNTRNVRIVNHRKLKPGTLKKYVYLEEEKSCKMKALQKSKSRVMNKLRQLAVKLEKEHIYEPLDTPFLIRKKVSTIIKS